MGYHAVVSGLPSDDKNKRKNAVNKRLTAKLGFFRLAGTNERVDASSSTAGSHGIVRFFASIIS